MTDFANIRVGVLALQGDFARHAHQLRLVGATPSEVRTADHLEGVDALILPGGESTTMDILIDRFELRQPLKEFAGRKPIWGTCAGLIMLSRHIEDNLAGVKPLGLMDIDVLRNGYGRQVFSFEESLTARLDDRLVTFNGTFIRAPRIIRVGGGVKSLAAFQDSPVLVVENNLMASSFHTELDEDTTLLEFFLRKFLPQ